MNKLGEYILLKVNIKPIGFFYTDAKRIPRHWTVSKKDGVILLEKEFVEAARDIKTGQNIIIIFLFNKSRGFTKEDLLQTPMNKNKKMGVFSICSPIRPNPVGMSVLKVLAINGNKIRVNGIDMLNGTPIIDIKPYIKDKYDCPSSSETKEIT